MTVSTVPLKYLAAINEGVLPETTDPDRRFRYIDISTVGRGELIAEPEETSFRNAPSRARRLVKEGDTIVSTVRTYLRAVWPVTGNADDLVVSTGFAVISPREVHPRYLSWWLRSDVFIEEVVARSVGVSYPAINALELGELSVRVPHLAVQEAIAEFLDTETARIDALITKKRHLVDLLMERVAAATDRLALGLDAQTTQPSRTGFFERLPSQWDETTARHLGCHVQTGPFGSQLHAADYVEDGWPVVNPANLRDGKIVPIFSMAVSDDKRVELSRHILRPGDIVFGRRGEMARAGLVTDAEAGWLCGTGSLRLRLAANSPMTPEYMKLLLETSALRRYFELAAVGSTMDNLNSDIVLGMPCTIPTRVEQAEIVRSVGLLRSQAARLTDSLNSQIDLLNEHRQALITAAVTGELEVPGVAAA